MLIPGLVSISFRQLTPEQIAPLAVDAGLKCIEWGGDIHVPHGDVERAEQVRELTKKHNLALASYGSYLRLGGDHPADFDNDVVQTAAALGVRSIRVWPGTKASVKYFADERQRVVDHAKRLAEKAAKSGLHLNFEYHADTLTDTAESAIALHDDIDMPNVHLSWQPPNHMGFKQRLANLDQVIDRVTDVHSFNWTLDRSRRIVRHPLTEASDDWMAYLTRLNQTGRNHMVLLEFVPDDDPKILDREAQTLLTIIERSTH